MMSEEENVPSEPAVDSPELDTSPPPGEEGSEPEAREIQPDSQLLIWVEKADRSDRADKAIEGEELK